MTCPLSVVLNKSAQRIYGPSIPENRNGTDEQVSISQMWNMGISGWRD